MLLENKVAVIYGGGGGIGGAVARAFAKEGAHVFLAGLTQSKLDTVAQEIRGKGGKAETAVVDALDEKAVNAFVDKVASQAGHIDISFNVIGVDDVQKPLMDIALSEFMQPIDKALRGQFLTTHAVARHMIKQKSGVILTFGGSGPQTIPNLGGFKISLDAMESLRRQWAVELGQHGIRAVTIKTGGIPETIPESLPERKKIEDMLVKDTLLGHTATLDEVGHVAVFLASDHARSITATEINISAGAMVE